MRTFSPLAAKTRLPISTFSVIFVKDSFCSSLVNRSLMHLFVIFPIVLYPSMVSYTFSLQNKKGSLVGDVVKAQYEQLYDKNRTFYDVTLKPLSFWD